MHGFFILGGEMGKKVTRKNRKQKMSLESKVLIFFIVVILFTCSNFGLFGLIGRYISGIFFALMGSIFYAITLTPLILIAYALTKNADRKKFVKKVFMSLGIILPIMVLFEMIVNNGSTINESLSKNFFSPHLGGGLIGFLISKLFVTIFSRLGTIAILFILIMITALFITDLSLVKAFIEYLHEGAEKRERAKEKKRLEKLKEETQDTAKDVENIDLKYNEPENKNNELDKILEKLDSDIVKTIDVNKFEEDKKIKNLSTIQSGKESVKSEKSNDEKTVIEPITKTQQLFDNYKFPSTGLLTKGDKIKNDDNSGIRSSAIKLKQTLDSFGVNAEISDISKGPSVTRFEIVPDIGVKVSKIVGLADDIKLNLAAKDIRIEAPIPGKSAVGIEVPNSNTTMVRFRELVESQEFKVAKSKLSFCVGLSIEGKPVIADIQKMPHVLIAGATGSGKSVCINTLIMSILYKATPDEVKLIMIDPKVVELSIYNGIPHLLIPVVTDPRKAAGALSWAVSEMEKRYKQFAQKGVKDIFGYNEVIKETDEIKLPQIVIIIDELADLMMVASSEVEASICRLAQLARACGIHLVIATQRPSVNVITGLIKANIPSRIAFAVSSGVDSRTILDMNGAEKLLGRGDMLFHPAGLPKPERVQGAFIDEKEVSKVVKDISVNEINDSYTSDVQESIENSTSSSIAGDMKDRDEYFEEAARIIVEKQRASIGLLQRLLKIGFNRAARIMDQLFEAGIVGPDEGTKPRKVLVEEEQLENILKGE